MKKYRYKSNFKKPNIIYSLTFQISNFIKKAIYTNQKNHIINSKQQIIIIHIHYNKHPMNKPSSNSSKCQQSHRSCLKTQKPKSLKNIQQHLIPKSIQKQHNYHLLSFEQKYKNQLNNKYKLLHRRRRKLFQHTKSQITINQDILTKLKYNINQKPPNPIIKNNSLYSLSKQQLINKIQSLLKTNYNQHQPQPSKNHKQKSSPVFNTNNQFFNTINSSSYHHIMQQQITINLNHQKNQSIRRHSDSFIPSSSAIQQNYFRKKINNNNIFNTKQNLHYVNPQLNIIKKLQQKMPKIDYSQNNYSKFKKMQQVQNQKQNNTHNNNDSCKKQLQKLQIISTKNIQNEKKQTNIINTSDQQIINLKVTQKIKRKSNTTRLSINLQSQASIHEQENPQKLSTIQIQPKKQAKKQTKQQMIPIIFLNNSQNHQQPPFPQNKHPSSKTSQKNQSQIKALQQQYNQSINIINFITPTGQIASHYFKLLKKIKFNWFIPAILFYKNCYQKFKSYQPLYIQCQQFGVISSNQKNKFFQDNVSIEQNLFKFIQFAKKKHTIPNQSLQIINSKNNPNLPSIIQKQVITLTNTILQSNQKQNLDLLKCLLKMIQSIKILAQLKNIHIQIISNIQSINDNHHIFNLIKNDLSLIQLDQLTL